jgi:hypothetical protein
MSFKVITPYDIPSFLIRSSDEKHRHCCAQLPGSIRQLSKLTVKMMDGRNSEK